MMTKEDNSSVTDSVASLRGTSTENCPDGTVFDPKTGTCVSTSRVSLQSGGVQSVSGAGSESETGD